MKLKEFLTKWEWLDLEDADKTLTESEQKIWEIMQKNQDLEKQVEDKEKEIEELRFKERNIFPLVKSLEQKVDQAKTDFAIECLEKVRNEIDKTKSYFKGMEEWSKCKRNYFDLGFSDCQSCVWDMVDWQIHELRSER